MHQFLAPFESETVEQYGEHLEVVVLLVAHHIDHLVDGIVFEAHFGGADVLSHIHRCAVGAQQQFLVEPFIREVGPHAVVILAHEEPLGQSFFHLGLALQVSLRLIINLVKSHTERLVSLVKTGIHPVVHFFPKRTHLSVALFPFHEHLVSLLDERSLFLGLLFGLLFAHAVGHELGFELFHLVAVMLVKGHIVVAYQVVALLAAGFRRFAVAVFQPGQHRLADMYATVVDDVGFHYLVSVGLHDFGKAPSQQVVAHMPQMQRFVGVGRRVFNHYQWRILCSLFHAEMFVGMDGVEQRNP